MMLYLGKSHQSDPLKLNIVDAPHSHAAVRVS